MTFVMKPLPFNSQTDRMMFPMPGSGPFAREGKPVF